MPTYSRTTTIDSAPGGDSVKQAVLDLDEDLTNSFAHLNTLDTDKAPKANPTFTGVPAAPTAAAGTDTTQIATTAFVKTLGDTKEPLLTGATADTATADTDTVYGGNAGGSFATIKTTWTTIKAFLKTYFDTLYFELNDVDTTGTLGTSDTKVASQKAVKTYADTKMPIAGTNTAVTFGDMTATGNLTGDQIFVGSGAYSGTFSYSLAKGLFIGAVSNHKTSIISNNATVAEFSSTGLAVTGEISASALSVYADNTAAAALAAGTMYRTSTGVVMIKY